jgi:aldehyde dehydrogenase (NAD+)
MRNQSDDQHGHYVAGEWRAGAEYRPDISPADASDVVGYFATDGASVLDDAIEAAAAAAPAWADASGEQRADALQQVGDEIIRRADELANVLAREEGKTLAESRAEVLRAGRIFRFFAGEAVRVHGTVTPSVRPGVEVSVRRRPVGTVGIITPWNYPIAIPAWKIAPALAFGNSVVFKPADLVPASAWLLAEIISRAGLPAGVFNLVLGSGRTVGARLVSSPDIDALTFTGSSEVGRAIAVGRAERLRKVQLEMGGKNALLVADDADLDLAVTCAVDSGYFSTGQRCTASSRVVVMDRVYEEFVERLAARTRSLTVGHPLDAGVEVGPVASTDQLDQDLAYIKIGAAEGASLVAGGEVLERPTKGNYLAPTLFADATTDMRLSTEEIFGPIVATMRVGSYDEALAVVNDSRYGLTAGIVTRSLARAQHFQRHAAAGMVMVNLPTAGVDYHVPFGGIKDSSLGQREQGFAAREFFTESITSYLNPGQERG